jgi:enterobactin synthetase component D / holo-[acyl-carrier protein] synthase
MMLCEMLPPGIAVVEARAGDPSDPLLPAEVAALGRVSPGRRCEFTEARSCARRALVRLGLPPNPILIGPSREPVWPDGIVGSITHCTGYRAAATARRLIFGGIGIDAEPNDPLPPGILDMVAADDEKRWLDRLPAVGIQWDRLLFSAKESLYKVWYPLTHSWLGFHDGRLEISASGLFCARILADGAVNRQRPFESAEGRFGIVDGFIVTAIALVLPRRASTGVAVQSAATSHAR